MASKIVANCATGQVSVRTLSSGEELALATLREAALQESVARDTAATQRQADLATLRDYAAQSGAHPVFGALARLLGATG